jgi:lipid-A-disaccharide synthase
MLVIFPFEEDLYRQAGVEVTFVGHPLVDAVSPPADRAAFLRAHRLDPSRPVIALLPGSRKAEVAHNTPPLLGAVRLLAARRPDLQFLLARAPGLPDALFQRTREAVRVVQGETHAVVGGAALALVASGTATVETALLGTPMVVVYRLSPLTYALGRRFVNVPHYAMPNLIAGRRIVPELIQGDFTPERVSQEALRLLEDEEAAALMRQGLLEVRQKLGASGASERAAAVVAEWLWRTAENA